MKPREPRRGVMIAARVRWAGGWASATIRNVSRHGMMIAVDPAPPRGSYVEVRVGASQLATRAVWSDGDKAGLVSRETIDVDALGSARAASDAVSFPQAERRSAPRHPDPAEAAERSRARAHLFQFVIVALVGSVAASGVGWQAYRALAAPLYAIEGRL